MANTISGATCICDAIYCLNLQALLILARTFLDKLCPIRRFENSSKGKQPVLLLAAFGTRRKMHEKGLKLKKSHWQKGDADDRPAPNGVSLLDEGNSLT